jgi:hypothetical protein
VSEFHTLEVSLICSLSIFNSPKAPARSNLPCTRAASATPSCFLAFTCPPVALPGAHTKSSTQSRGRGSDVEPAVAFEGVVRWCVPHQRRADQRPRGQAAGAPPRGPPAEQRQGTYINPAAAKRQCEEIRSANVCTCRCRRRGCCRRHAAISGACTGRSTASATAVIRSLLMIGRHQN